MSSFVRRLTVRAMKNAGLSRDRQEFKGTDPSGKPVANPTFGHIVDLDGNNYGRHFPRAIPARFAPLDGHELG